MIWALVFFAVIAALEGVFIYLIFRYRKDRLPLSQRYYQNTIDTSKII